MAEIGPLTLSIVVNAQSLNNLEQVVEQADDSFQQSNKEINSTLEKYTKIQIEIYKTQIEYLKKQEEVLKQLKQREGLEDLFDFALFTRTGVPSSNLLLDLVENLANSPKDLAISKQTLTNIAEILYLYSQITNLGEIVENKKLNILGKIIELSPEEIEAYNEKLTQMKERLEELDNENDQLLKEQQTISDPLQSLIFNSEEYRKKLEEIVKDLEQFNKVGGDVNVPLSNEESLKEAENILKRVKDQLKGSNEQFRLSMELTGVQAEGIGNLNQVYADFNKALGTTAASQGKFSKSFEDVLQKTSEGAVILGLTKEELSGLRDVTDEATKSTENLGENGFTAVKENVEQAGNKLGTLDANLMNVADRNKDVADTQEQVNQSLDNGTVAFDNVGASAEEFGETLDKVENQGGFFEGIKQGFIDFVENVQSNSELMADFFANTLSQMSQSFSDLFFNIITGKFDDLKDLAKQAFEAILRAFLDLVSAIATRQIVISIGGLFGIGKGAQAAGGGGNPTDIAQQGAGVVGSGLGLFGSGGAFETLGAAFGGGLEGVEALPGLASLLGQSELTTLATPGFLATAGAAITVIGAVLAVAALAFTIIAPFLEKTPRLDIDFDSIKTEAGRRAALVSELLDDDFLKDEIIDISVKRKAGLGLGGDEGIKDVLADAIQVAVNNLLDIINKLPTDLAETLSEELLNTPLDTETEVAGERLFEFDAKGKKIAEKFNQLINGEIQAKFLFAVDGFLQTMFESLGVLPEAAEAFLDERFEEFKNAGSREARAKVGQELLADINAFVDAFNIVSGNVNDAIGQTIQSINSLSRKLGFDAVPSIGELTDKLGELIQNAELDAETVQMYADLRNAIVQGISDIINSISGLIGKISQLNSTIVGLGGAAVNIIPFLDQAQAKLVDFYTTNIDNLSLGEQESFLDQILGVANAKLAEEQAAFQRAQEARQRAEEAQRERIQKRIDNLNKEKDKINEVFQKRIEALNEELQIAESFAQLTESIRQTLDSILFSPESVLTGVEQVNALKSNITGLQAQLASSTDPEKQLEIAGRLEEAFKTLFDKAGGAFGVNSPEFVAIFDQVTGGLEGLAGFTEGQGRSVEEISAEIERITAVNEATLKSIDAKIEAAQERLANIGQSTADNTFRASQELTELFEFIRSEYIRILEERFAELGEISEFGFATETEGLSVIAGLTDESLTVLKGVGEETAKQTGYLADIAGRLGALAGFQRGSEGFRDFGRGTLAVLHGFEAVVTRRDIAAVQDSILHQIAGAGVSGLAERLAGDGGGRDGLSRGGFIAGMRPGGGFVPEFPLSGVRPLPDEPVNHVTEMSVDINVNVNGGSQASIASLAGEIENMMVRSIRQGRVRKELQEAAVRRVG